MVDNSERPSINISAVPVAGIGGLGMVGLVVIMAMAFPVARWLLLGGLGGGALIATGLVLSRRHHRIGGSDGDHPIGLFSSVESAAPPATARHDTPSLSEEHRLAAW
jgi:hypothetical protein